MGSIKGDEMDKVKKIAWTKFRSALMRDGINVDNTPNFWRDQLHMWNCGIRDDRMQDNALATLGSL